MLQRHQYQAYATASQTVAKTRQIVMLYEGAVRFMQQAVQAIDEKRIEDRYHLLVKTSEIIGGLQGCLDFENGGDIAHLLNNYYASIDMRIFALHRSGDRELAEQIIRELKQMRDAWSEIDSASTDAKTGSSTPEAAHPQPHDPTVPPQPAAVSTVTVSA